MIIDIQSIHFSPGLELLNFINKKIDKLSQLDSHLMHLDIYLKIVSPENKITEIRVHSSNAEFFAKKQSDTFEGSVNLTIRALRKQVLKMKGK